RLRWFSFGCSDAGCTMNLSKARTTGSDNADIGRPGTTTRGLLLLVATVGALVMVLPFVWMLSTACKSPPELSRLPIRFIPETVSCAENLQQLYSTSPQFNRYLLNSALLTVGRTLGQLVTCSLAAYGFARFKFPGRNLL